MPIKFMALGQSPAYHKINKNILSKINKAKERESHWNFNVMSS